MFMLYHGNDDLGLIPGNTYWCNLVEQQDRNGNRKLVVYVGDYYTQGYNSYRHLIDDWTPKHG